MGFSTGRELVEETLMGGSWRGRMVERGIMTKLARMVAAGCLMAAICGGAVPQTKSGASAGSGPAGASGAAKAVAVKDPEMIDAAGYQALLAKYKGQPLVITFWATWCEPCRAEYPMLNELAKQYAPQGLKVVGVNLDQDGDLILTRRFMARYKPVFPNYRKTDGGEKEFVNAVLPGWSGAIPASFFYARDGRQIGKLLGESDRDTYEAAIRTVLSSGSGN
jgi:thiol-disulfide isomerase/thioredoxin